MRNTYLSTIGLSSYLPSYLAIKLENVPGIDLSALQILTHLNFITAPRQGYSAFIILILQEGIWAQRCLRGLLKITHFVQSNYFLKGLNILLFFHIS